MGVEGDETDVEIKEEVDGKKRGEGERRIGGGERRRGGR